MKTASIFILTLGIILEIVILVAANEQMNENFNLLGSARAQSEMNYLFHYFTTMILSALYGVIFILTLIVLTTKRLINTYVIFLITISITGILLPLLFFYG